MLVSNSLWDSDIDKVPEYTSQQKRPSCKVLSVFLMLKEPSDFTEELTLFHRAFKGPSGRIKMDWKKYVLIDPAWRSDQYRFVSVYSNVGLEFS
jgi:hypothetical protein